MNCVDRTGKTKTPSRIFEQRPEHYPTFFKRMRLEKGEKLCKKFGADYQRKSGNPQTTIGALLAERKLKKAE